MSGATGEIGFYRSTAAARIPRDNRGRFARVRHSAQHRIILRTAARMRAQLGLAPLDALSTQDVGQ